MKLVLLAVALSATPAIHIEDVERFYQVYDAAGGHPTAEQLQRDYLDQGSEGLYQLAKVRNVTGVRIADTLTKRPELYSGARRCLAVLPRVRQRVAVALQELVRLYPQARKPPVTIAVGRGKPVGVGSPVTGLQIGLEALCAAQWTNPDAEERFVHVIAHEYAHVQQVQALVDDEHPTVLERSLGAEVDFRKNAPILGAIVPKTGAPCSTSFSSAGRVQHCCVSCMRTQTVASLSTSWCGGSDPGRVQSPASWRC